MNATLLVALLAGVPLATISWLAAATVERLGAGVRLRLAAWTAALIMPIALAPAALLIEALDIRSPLAALRSAPAPQTTITDIPAMPTIAPLPTADTPATPSAPTFTLPDLAWTHIILAVLAMIAALRLAALALALRRVSRLVAASEPLQGEGYGGEAPVRQSDHDTPILAGFRRPVVLLPRKLVASLTPAQAALICAHEQAHLAAGDHVAHLIEEVALRLFWFNPVLGPIRARLSAAREEACDARALAASDKSTRRAYAESLLAALRLAGDAEPIAAFTGLGHHDSARRLLAILHPRPEVSAPAVAAAGILSVCLAMATGGLSLAVAAEPLGEGLTSRVPIIGQSQYSAAAEPPTRPLPTIRERIVDAGDDARPTASAVPLNIRQRVEIIADTPPKPPTDNSVDLPSELIKSVDAFPDRRKRASTPTGANDNGEAAQPPALEVSPRAVGQADGAAVNLSPVDPRTAIQARLSVIKRRVDKLSDLISTGPIVGHDPDYDPPARQTREAFRMAEESLLAQRTEREALLTEASKLRAQLVALSYPDP